MTLSVIIPCFNEANTIREIFARVKAAKLPPSWQKEIIIVDDGSQEATKDTLRALLLENPEVKVIFKEKNGGKGSAVKAGIAKATGEYLLIQDADLEYDPNDYARLLVPILEGKTTVVFGSRTRGDNVVPFSQTYFYGGLLITWFFNLAFGTHLTDVATCYKIFPRSSVPELLRLPNDDFVYDVIELSHVLARHTEIVEVPISYDSRTRKEGKKINWHHGVRCGLAICWLRVGFDLSAGMRIMRFVAAGTFAAALNLLILYVATAYGHIWYLYSAMISFVLSQIVSFLLNKFWTFQNHTLVGSHIQLAFHFLTAVVNLGVNTLLMYLFVEKLGVWYLLAQIFSSATISFESYFAYKWVYRKPVPKKEALVI
jgi:glycosyltransferase involved in cell wall biosynthesis